MPDSTQTGLDSCVRRNDIIELTIKVISRSGSQSEQQRGKNPTKYETPAFAGEGQVIVGQEAYPPDSTQFLWVADALVCLFTLVVSGADSPKVDCHLT
ncbi:MAG: hypothetical protein DWP97_09115 [Calditrichaeota bacterium]|nr:MAG: hypothetical protein DWP97_09115 [Calditrichota bacterium]